MSEVALIVMPYELSRLRDGVGRGPEHLLEAGAEAALASAGARVSTEVIELEGRHSDEIEACFALISLVRDAVRAAIARGAFPVVLSGSCFASIGVVAGLGEPAPGVVWLDAHGDFNEPSTGIHGYFDGMGLSVLTGGAWQGLRAGVEGAEPVPEALVVLAGARDLDPPEAVRLRKSAIAQPSAADLADPDRLLAAIEGLAPAPSGVYLHVDLDVLDIEVAKVNRYAAAGGVSGDDLQANVAAVLGRGDVKALPLTAYDPECDTADAVPPIALRLLELAGRR